MSGRRFTMKEPGMAAVQGENTIVIDAPARMVYDYLLDFTRHPEWVANLTEVRQSSPGPIGVGTSFQAQEGPPPVPMLRKVRMMVYFIAGLASGAKPYSQAEITALEPGRRIAWRAGIPRGTGYFNLAEWEFVLQTEGQATRVTQRFFYQPQAPAAARMIGAAGEGGIERACAVSLARLKAVLEQGLTQASEKRLAGRAV
jgi:uncharacterized membrane protein